MGRPMGYKVSEATKEKIRLSREVNRERRAGQHEEQPLSSSVTEEGLEAYRKGNYSRPIRLVQEAKAPKEDDNQQKNIVSLYFSIDSAIHDQLAREAEAEGRSVPAHISWLMKCLYDPPAMVSSSRTRDMATRKIYENI